MRQGLWGYSSTIVRILQVRGVGGGSSWTEGLVVACVVLQRRVWLGLRRCPARTTLRRFWVQGDSPCTPGGGCAPCTLLGGEMGAAFSRLPPGAKVGDKMRLLDGWFCFGLRPPSAEGLAWPAPLSHLPTLQRFWVQGDSPCTSRRSIGFPAPSFERQVRLSLSIAGDSLYPRRGPPLHPAWGMGRFLT